MRTFALAVALTLGCGGTALADRPLTDQERAQLTAALQAQGCSDGTMQFDDGKFEVDDARCADGKTYDLEFDASFKLIKKDKDD